MIELKRIDHFVLRVSDVQRTCDFYSRVLGMRVVSHGDKVKQHALHFGAHKINLHPDDTDWIRAANATVGGEDFCLITETPMNEVLTHLKACGVEIEVPPCDRQGALGTIRSVYFRDPDGNLVEISNYL